MASTTHRCPACKIVGRVHRSRTRSLREKIITTMAPVLSVYRCHNCNWRGWLPRSNSSQGKVRLVMGAYILLVLIILAFIAYWIITHWPNAVYKY